MSAWRFMSGNLRADGRQDADTPLTEIVRHVDYIARRIGIDHVGVRLRLRRRDHAAGAGRRCRPAEPHRRDAPDGCPLAPHGFDEPSLRKVACENWLRLLEQTLA